MTNNDERSEKLASAASPKTVTAQDFLGAIEEIRLKTGPAIRWKNTEAAFDALLSRARQEAVEECHRKVMEFPLEGIKKEIDAMILKARREALKEMDGAWDKLYYADDSDIGKMALALENLRKEYLTN